MSSLALLFVYGTLKQGSTVPAAQRLHEASSFVGPATVAGGLYMVAETYPGLVPDGSGVVHGELWRVPCTVFAFLDDYEGEEYERRLIDVGDGHQAWTYVWLGAVAPEHRLEDGRFRLAEERDFPAPGASADPGVA